jgi:hypothetical protein
VSLTVAGILRAFQWLTELRNARVAGLCRDCVGWDRFGVLRQFYHRSVGTHTCRKCGHEYHVGYEEALRP